LHPILFKLWGTPVYTYGVSYMLAVILTYLLVVNRAPRYNFPARAAGISAALGGAGVFLGSYLLFRTHYFLLGATGVALPAGQYFLGGMVLGILAIWLYPAAKGLNPLHFSDFGLTYTLIGVALHRAVGCFGAGCCFGAPTGLPWGIVFPPDSPAGQAFGSGVKLHPTQLYESAFLLLLFAISYYWLDRRRRHGEVTALIMVGYSCYRFFAEFLRGAPLLESQWFFLSFNQMAAVICLAMGLLLAMYVRVRGAVIAPVPHSR